MKIEVEEKFHYFLVAGQVTFLSPQEDGTKIPRTVNLNTLAPLQDRKVEIKALGVMQQQLQRVLFSRIGGTEEVIDVILTGISYLGHMTAKEFGHDEPDVSDEPEQDE